MIKMSLADSLNAFAEAIKALDARIAALEKRCECCCAPAPAPAPEVAASAPEVVAAPEVAPAPEDAAAPEVAPTLADNETLVNLDLYSPDTIQNELWQTFRSISDAGKIAVVAYSGEYPRNIIVYANPETRPLYRNAGAAEVRIIQALEGTLIATLQPGETVGTPYYEGKWTVAWYVD